MKYLVIAKPGAITIPPDQGEKLLQASKDWIKVKLGDGSMDVTYNFFGGGGFAITNADSHETVLKELLGYPMYPFFQWEVTPILDQEESFNHYIAFYQKLGSM